MKITEFNRLKFFRSYIGGSKKREIELLNKVQGNNDDNSDCDWFAFRRLLYVSYYDKLNVIFSWRTLLNRLTILLLVLIVFSSTMNITISIILFLTSIIFQIISTYLKKREKKVLSNYNLCLSIILNEINKLTGLNLNIN